MSERCKNSGACRWVSYLPLFKISALCGYHGLHTRPEAAEDVGIVTQKLCYGMNCPFSGPNSGPGTWCPSSRTHYWFLVYGSGGYIKTRACATTHTNLVTMKAKMEVEWATMPRYYTCTLCHSFWPCVEAMVATESRNYKHRKVKYPSNFCFTSC